MSTLDIKTISKFAQLEFKYGDPERGRTIFEGIVSNYPKRVDLWNVFLDMEGSIGDVQMIRYAFLKTQNYSYNAAHDNKQHRQLFERAIKLKVSSRKIKFFFKRYLQFEKTMGTEQGVEHVKTAAKAYVERIAES